MNLGGGRVQGTLAGDAGRAAPLREACRKHASPLAGWPELRLLPSLVADAAGFSGSSDAKRCDRRLPALEALAF